MSPFIVTEEYAVIWTGRPAATIRGWAHAGRITRHGSGRGRVRYDLAEMYAKSQDEDGNWVPGATPDKLRPLATLAA